MGAVRMRNAKPAAKESRLHDYALTAISGARTEAGRAQALLESGQVIGKLLLKP
jgi:hypothetical protein